MRSLGIDVGVGKGLDLVLLDEPFAGIDPIAVAELQGFVQRILLLRCCIEIVPGLIQAGLRRVAGAEQFGLPVEGLQGQRHVGLGLVNLSLFCRYGLRPHQVDPCQIGARHRQRGLGRQPGRNQLRAIEDGEHVRRGYTQSHLVELCEQAGLRIDEMSSCSGVLSQKATWVTYTTGRANSNLARALTAPLHPVVRAMDRTVSRWLDWPPYSWCIAAVKPRFP